MNRSSTARAGGRSKGLILTGMIFAVAMTLIEQTIVSIAGPTIQRDLVPVAQRYAVGDQRLPTGAGGPVRLRRRTTVAVRLPADMRWT